MTCYREFPDFPVADMPALPEGWIDTSYHNDACPSYTSPDGVVIWIDYADPAQREFPGQARFTVTYLDADGCHLVDDITLDFDTFQAALDHAAMGNTSVDRLLEAIHENEFDFWVRDYGAAHAQAMANAAVEREKAKRNA